METLDQALVKILTDFWLTEIKAKIYLHLRKAGPLTAEQIATQTGLYITSVREALTAMHQEGILVRTKLQKSGSGKPPYVYQAIPPFELVTKLGERIQEKLSRILLLDDILKQGRWELKLPRLPVRVVLETRQTRSDKAS